MDYAPAVKSHEQLPGMHLGRTALKGDFVFGFQSAPKDGRYGLLIVLLLVLFGACLISLFRDFAWQTVVAMVFIASAVYKIALVAVMNEQVCVFKDGVAYSERYFFSIFNPKDGVIWNSAAYVDILYVDFRGGSFSVLPLARGKFSPVSGLGRDECKRLYDTFIAFQRRGDIPASIDVKSPYA
ncbi:MAG: hypothetical protein QFF03_19900 [Pseudomonadota bacterium]|nr:hypothetical protein [Pseudomonadota bacterium]